MDVVSVTAEPRDHLEKSSDQDDEGEIVLPGFRFHPTDEELVGFYLRRKVDNKPIKIELIKQIDIYKYDPWDLPNGSESSSVGEKEWYFFCVRGRKYRNSVRPNRVTGSGFWKATGIDKPIYCGGEPHECIGLKKSLVYYRGSAGKGTKTDWMMHEYRLPPYSNGSKRTHTAQPHVANTIHQEAEVWTICRIFKRIPLFKKYTPNLKSTSAMTKQSQPSDSSSKTCSSESDNMKPQLNLEDSSPVIERCYSCDVQTNHLGMTPFSSVDQPSFAAPYGYTSSWNPTVDDVFANGSWDELRSVVQLATDPSSYVCP